MVYCVRVWKETGSAIVCYHYNAVVLDAHTLDWSRKKSHRKFIIKNESRKREKERMISKPKWIWNYFTKDKCEYNSTSTFQQLHMNAAEFPSVLTTRQQYNKNCNVRLMCGEHRIITILKLNAVFYLRDERRSAEKKDVEFITDIRFIDTQRFPQKFRCKI